MSATQAPRAVRVAPKGRAKAAALVARFRVVIGLTVLAALVRFPTLDAQSFWYDEALTLDVVRRSFGSMLDGVFAHEAQPPPHYILTWLWIRVFGDGEVGLRSLPALLGTLTVPVAYAAGKAVAGRRVAITVGLLTALSPPLVWYSQEARAYALVTFLCAVSLLFFVRSLDRPSGRDLALWALASVLAVASHYFALFLVLPQAAWLLWRAADRRLTVRALAGLCLGLVAVAPMLLHQRRHGGAEWIGLIPLHLRVRDAGFFFLAGPSGAGPMPHHKTGVLLVGVLVYVAAVGALAVWGEDRLRRRAALMLGVGVAVVGIPMVLSFVGSDFLLDRNLLPAWLPLTIVAAAGLCVERLRWAGLAVIALACAVFAYVDVSVPRHEGLQRDDWRHVAAVLGPPRPDRVVEVSPKWQVLPLALYVPRLQQMNEAKPVSSVVTVTLGSFVPWGSPVAAVAPGPPFRVIRARVVQRLTVTEYEAPKPVLVRPESLSGRGINGALPFVAGP